MNALLIIIRHEKEKSWSINVLLKCQESEDVSKFCSSKTNRGPLAEGWRETTQPIMCSYKLVDVRFDMMYLLQGKIEQTVHNVRILLLC